MRHRRKKKDSQNNAARISLGLRVGLESIRAAGQSRRSMNKDLNQGKRLLSASMGLVALRPFQGADGT